MDNIKVGKNTKTEEKNFPLKAVLKGIGVAYAITVIVFIAYAVLLTYTEITEKNIDLIVMVTVVVSVLIAGFDSARGASDKGWLWGMGAGLIYVLIMFFVGFCVVPEYSLGSESVMHLVLGLAGGGLGGIIGINIKK